MSNLIGFVKESCDKKIVKPKCAVSAPTVAPRKSVVQVYFESRGVKLSYYNDQHADS